MEKDQLDTIKNYLDLFKTDEFGPIVNDEFNVIFKSSLSKFKTSVIAYFNFILQKLRSLTNELRAFNIKTTNEGEKECNRKKNRYRDILPCKLITLKQEPYAKINIYPRLDDDSRVELETAINSDEKPINGSDYINASFIKNSLDGYYKYIAAQGPSKDTVVDFIRMLVQYNVKIVICACNEFEGNRVT